MRALILGKFVNFGGTQYLSHQVKKVLDQMGYDTDIVCGKEHQFLPAGVKNIIETGYPYVSEERRYGVLRNQIKLKAAVNRIDTSRYDFTFNNHPNNFLFNADINYLHGPSLVESMISENGAFQKNLIYYVVKALSLYRVFDDGVFLTHGRYTADLAKKYLPMIGVRPRTIDYAFIPVDTDIKVDFSRKEERTVLIFGRIARAKRIEQILERAANIDCNFIVAGYVADGEKEYLKTLSEKESDNVKIIPNPTSEEKSQLFSKSWTYLHTKPREHFGVTVVEALSNGCVPVVPKSGGPWIDISQEGSYGLGYEDNEELVQKLNESFEMSLSERERIYSSRYRFSYDRFRERVEKLISSLREEAG